MNSLAYCPFYKLILTYFGQTRAPCLILFFMVRFKSLQNDTSNPAYRTWQGSCLWLQRPLIFLRISMNSKVYFTGSTTWQKSFKHAWHKFIENKKWMKKRTCCLLEMNHRSWWTVRLQRFAAVRATAQIHVVTLPQFLIAVPYGVLESRSLKNRRIKK